MADVKDKSRARRHLNSLPLSDVTPARVEWLWTNYIPRSKLTLLTGYPGIGKSFILLDIASRVTVGERWPDTTERAPKGHVIYMTAEDDLNDTVAPRVMAAGGDRSKITVVQYVYQPATPEKRLVFHLGHDLPELRELIAEKRPEIVLIDPITSYLGDIMNKASEVRSLLEPVRMLAEEMRVAIVGVMHPNKSSDQRALHKIGGSAAFGEVARQVIACVRNENGCFFGVLKTNVGLTPDGILPYELVQNTVAWAPRVRWKEMVPGRIEELMDAQTITPIQGERYRARQKIEVAENWLLDLLADNPMEVADVYDILPDTIAPRTLKRARKKLEGVIITQTTGRGEARRNVWMLTNYTKAGP